MLFLYIHAAVDNILANVQRTCDSRVSCATSETWPNSFASALHRLHCVFI